MWARSGREEATSSHKLWQDGLRLCTPPTGVRVPRDAVLCTVSAAGRLRLRDGGHAPGWVQGVFSGLASRCDGGAMRRWAVDEMSREMR
jgi:hypothetical protein